MFNFNPDIMQLDDGATGAPRVTGPGNAPVTEEELANDLLSIVQVFCCRRNGKRR
jgi:hypothetical protein